MIIFSYLSEYAWNYFILIWWFLITTYVNPEPGCYHPERGTQAESVAVITAPCALSSLPSFINDAIPACGRVGVYLVCPVDRCVSQYDNHVSLSRLEMKRRVHRGSGVRWVQPVRGHRYIVVFERGREDGRTGNILWKKCLITKSPGVEGVPFLPPHISYLNRPFS